MVKITSRWENTIWFRSVSVGNRWWQFWSNGGQFANPLLRLSPSWEANRANCVVVYYHQILLHFLTRSFCSFLPANDPSAFFHGETFLPSSSGHSRSSAVTSKRRQKEEQKSRSLQNMDGPEVPIWRLEKRVLKMAEHEINRFSSTLLAKLDIDLKKSRHAHMQFQGKLKIQDLTKHVCNWDLGNLWAERYIAIGIRER